MEDYLVYILSPLFAVSGFIIRFTWELFINRRRRELTDKIKLVEFRLKDFYYPIFFCLKREQIIWDKIIKLHKQTFSPTNILIDSISVNVNTSQNIGEYSQQEADIHLENDFNIQIIKALDEENLKLHKIVQQIIHDKICTALPPKYLVQLLMQYDEHVTVYQILRAMNIYDRFPIEYDAPYPPNIIVEVEKRIRELDEEYIKYNKKLG